MPSVTRRLAGAGSIHGLCSQSIIAIIVACILLLPSRTEALQLSASGAVPISVTVRGSVSVSLTSTPVSVSLHSDAATQSHAAVPLSVKWNLNPSEVQGFEVIGYFSQPAMALVHHARGVAVPSGDVQGRFNLEPFQPFDSTTAIGPAGGSLILFSEAVLPGRARGKRSGLVELRIADQAVPELPTGEYQGVLNIEVRHY